MAGERVTLTDLLNIRRNLHVKRGHGGAHPLRMLRIAAEHVRVTETWVLLGNATPHVPAAAGLDFRSPCGRFGLRAHGRVFHAATIGDEHQVVFAQINASRGAIRFGQVDARSHFLGWRTVRVAYEHAGFSLLLQNRVLTGAGMRTYRSHASANLEIDILHLHVVVELHAESFQILDHRQNHRLILVVTGKTQRAEVWQSANMMNISTDIQLHFQRTMPIFESEHGAPVHPEIRIEDFIVEIIRNFLAVQFLIRREEQLHDLHRGFV